MGIDHDFHDISNSTTFTTFGYNFYDFQAHDFRGSEFFFLRLSKTPTTFTTFEP